MALRGEKGLQHFAHDLLVVDDENRTFLGVAPLRFHFCTGLHCDVWSPSLAIWLLKRQESTSSTQEQESKVDLNGAPAYCCCSCFLKSDLLLSVADGLQTGAVQSGGKRDTERGALTGGAVNIDVARMLLNDSV